jgi:hypothetical protein
MRAFLSLIQLTALALVFMDSNGFRCVRNNKIRFQL